MGCSEAQLVANRANAARSTGPRTEAGKERSRRNSLRHGLTGAGIVLPTEDLGEIEARFAEFEADLQPKGGVARFLVRRAALLSIRLDRSALHEAANSTTRILDLPPDEPADVDLDAEMDELFESALAQPGSTRDEVLDDPEGIERLIAALMILREKLVEKGATAWSTGHARLLEALLGHDPEAPPTRSKSLSDVVLGDCSQLVAETTDLDAEGKRFWAAARLARLIDAEIGQLREHQATLPPPAPRVSPTAAKLALFDASVEANLARRYEASTERALFRTLKEVRQINTQHDQKEQVAAFGPTDLPPRLGSFCRGPSPVGPASNFAPPAPVSTGFPLDRVRPGASRRPEQVVIGCPPTG